jgi:purine nucleosidase
VDYLIQKAREFPGKLSLIAIGPLTNLAMAIRRDPAIIEAFREVIIMGGAIRHEGNTTPLAEFNTYVDPHAAHIVYHAGLPITLVPLDVTYQCVFTQTDVERLLKEKSPIADFIADATRFYMDFHDDFQSIKGCVINDPLALALSFKPDLVDLEDLYVDVDLSGGVSMGKTFADFYDMEKQVPNMRVALDVRPRAFMDLFLDRMLSLIEQRR